MEFLVKRRVSVVRFVAVVIVSGAWLGGAVRHFAACQAAAAVVNGD